MKNLLKNIACYTVLSINKKNKQTMNEKEINAFYEEHKMKIGKDYRLEILKLPKEDIHDYMEYKYSDWIHGWRNRLTAEMDKNRQLKEAMQALLQEPELRDEKSREFFLSEANVLPNGDLASFQYGAKKYHDYLQIKINNLSKLFENEKGKN